MVLLDRLTNLLKTGLFLKSINAFTFKVFKLNSQFFLFYHYNYPFFVGKLSLLKMLIFLMLSCVKAPYRMYVKSAEFQWKYQLFSGKFKMATSGLTKRFRTYVHRECFFKFYILNHILEYGII